MMKIVAAVLCLSVLVSSQDMFGSDGLGSIFAINLLSGRPAFDLSGLFGGSRAGGYPVQLPAQARGGTGSANAAAAAAAAAAASRRQSPLGGLGGLLLLEGMGVM